MVSGSSNTLGNFGLSALTTVGNLRVTRIKGATDTAGVLTFGVWNGTAFYECWRSYLTDVRYTGFDDDFQPRSKSTLPQDWLTIPLNNSYTPAFQWSTTPTGGGVHVSGIIQISNTVGQVTANIVT